MGTTSVSINSPKHLFAFRSKFLLTFSKTMLLIPPTMFSFQEQLEKDVVGTKILKFSLIHFQFDERDFIFHFVCLCMCKSRIAMKLHR